MKRVQLTEYKRLYEMVRAQHENSNEPVPELSRRSLLEVKYILGVPFQYSFGEALYYGFYKRAAVLLYLMIKNHPLANGNKRMAVATMLFFYEKNKKEIFIDKEQLYELAYFVVNSEAQEHEIVILQVARKLKVEHGKKS